MAQFAQGGTPTVAFLNKSSTPLERWVAGHPGLTVAELVAATQLWYDRHVLPFWGYPLKLYEVPAGQKPRADEWQVVFLANSDEAGAAGYHDTGRSPVNGRQPLSRVFTQGADDVSLTTSHEVAEMALDPGAGGWVDGQDGWEYALELCDPVEEDLVHLPEYPGLPMSSIVHPCWFEPWPHPRGTPFDTLKKLRRPFSLRPGGYYERRMITTKVEEKFGSAAKARRFAREDRRGHRTELRKPRGLVITRASRGSSPR